MEINKPVKAAFSAYGKFKNYLTTAREEQKERQQEIHQRPPITNNQDLFVPLQPYGKQLR
jgi:hypothetical protein